MRVGVAVVRVLLTILPNATHVATLFDAIAVACIEVGAMAVDAAPHIDSEL